MAALDRSADATRLAALHRYAVLDTPPDAALDELTRLASEVCDASMSLVSLVDASRQWFKSRHGLEVPETDREVSFCDWAIRTPHQLFEVEDASLDPRFAHNPLVVGAPYLRFYVGAPLVTPDGHAIGTLCVLDRKPLRLNDVQRQVLSALARHVMSHLELMRKERVLRERSAMLEAIMNTSVAAIVQLSPDGRILYANPAGETVLGLERSRILERTYDSPEWRHAGLSGEPWPDEAQPFRRVMASKAPVLGVEHAIEWPDGRRRELSVNGAPILDERGEVESLVFSVTDITERRRMERQLRQTERMEALGTLAGGIAHDFNNLLTAILGNAELLSRDLHQAASPRMLSDVLHAGRRARDLVRQILTFSRQQPMERSPVRLHEVVSDVEKLLRATLPAGIAFDAHVSPDTPRVLAAPSQLHQAILNLCVNASQAMPTHLGHVRVEACRRTLGVGEVLELPAGDYACISVVDDGAGMDAATRARIFDPFFTTKPPGEGTGLGLAVVDGIVKNHEGAVLVESEPGKGSCFRIYLPALEQQALTVSPARADSSPPLAVARILFVDDEDLLLRVGKLAMQSLGHTVDGFSDAQAAIDAFRKDPHAYDLIITDMNMPGMTGLIFAQQIARIRPGAPIVLASGFVSDDLGQHLSAAGIVAVLAKPHTRDELRRTIDKALGQRS